MYLVTSKKLETKAWPRESLDEIFYVEDKNDEWAMDDVVKGLAYVMRAKRIDRIVSLDDFDVEKGAHLREEFRLAGMGQTTHRYFRDKLAMRMQAADAGIPVPAFSALFHDAAINEFADTVAAPWVVKPRGEASAAGISKVHTKEELWKVVHSLGDNRHRYLVEQFKPGAVYHADALTYESKQLFCRVSQYLATPMEVAHGGGIFRSMISTFGSEDDKALQKLNEEVMKAFGMKYSASHTEFIKCNEDGKFYFLETSSRVGGANLAEMVEASSGINLWREWARIEVAVAKGTKYVLPKISKNYAGIIVSLAREKHPNTKAIQDSEIYWRLDMEYHVGLIVKASTQKRVLELLDSYATIVQRDFHAAAPPKTKPTN